MSFTHCNICRHRFTKSNGDVPHADGGFMEINHGGGVCRECYLKNHWESSCGWLPMDSWKFCPNCGESKPQDGK